MKWRNVNLVMGLASLHLTGEIKKDSTLRLSDAMSAAMELQTQTACFHNTEIMFLPTGTHDPGEMTPEQVSALAI